MDLFLSPSSIYPFVVCNCPDVVTKDVIEKFIRLWKSQPFISVIGTKDVTESTFDTDGIKDGENSNDEKPFFGALLSSSGLMMQQHKSQKTFDLLANLLTALVKNNLINLSFINSQCVSLLRHEWNQVIFLPFYAVTKEKNCQNQ